MTRTGFATSIARPDTQTSTAPRAPLWLRLLNGLAERDRRHRDARKLRGLPDERLDDLGISRDRLDRIL